MLPVVTLVHSLLHSLLRCGSHQEGLTSTFPTPATKSRYVSLHLEFFNCNIEPLFSRILMRQFDYRPIILKTQPATFRGTNSALPQGTAYIHRIRNKRIISEVYSVYRLLRYHESFHLWTAPHPRRHVEDETDALPRFVENRNVFASQYVHVSSG